MHVGEAIYLVLVVMVLGICVAFLAALLIRAIVAVLARQNGGQTPAQTTRPSAPVAAAPSAPSAARAAIPTDDLVAVFAAVQTVLGSARVVSIEPATRMAASNDLVAIAAAVQATLGNQRIVSIAPANL